MSRVLFSDEALKAFPPLYSTDGTNPMVKERLYHPLSCFEWYPIEFDPESRDFFGLVSGFEVELGYFNLDELADVVVYKFHIERDRFFTPVRLHDLMASLKALR